MGMNVAASKQRASAHNVSNLQTDGFQAVETTQEAISTGGVTAQVRPTGDPSPMVWRGDQLVVGSNTDLVRETVNQITALGSYRANAAVFKTADEMSEALLEIIA